MEKLYAARQAGMRAILVPRENAREIDATPEGIERDLRRNSRGSARRARRARPCAARAARTPHDYESVPLNVAPFVSTIDRIPPSNLEAEMALLGSILVDKEMMSTVAEIVQPSDFYASLHESIYLALFALYERGEPLDKVALAEELRNRGMLDKIGGLAYLNSLMDTVPTAASAEYYARIVREKSTLRGLIHAGTQVTQLGYESEDDVPAAIDRAEQVVYDVGNRSEHNAFATVPSLLLGVFQSLERRHEQKGDRTGVTSGFRDIDDYTAGWQPGNLIIIAARPAMGKTSIALNMAVAAAKDEQKPIALFSLEMTKQELVERFLSSEARLDASKLRRGAIADRDWEKIGHAMGVLHELPIYLDDAGAVTVTEIRSRLRRLKSAHPARVARLADHHLHHRKVTL